MITKFLHKPAAIAQQVVGGVARGALHAAAAVVRRILPDVEKSRAEDAPPTVSPEPVHQPPSPTTTTKKAAAKKAGAKRAATKRAAKKAAPKKPASTLDEGVSPDEADPVVYSSGPDVATNVSKDDLDGLRP